MTLDRTIAPIAYPIEKVDIPKLNSILLDNSNQLFITNIGEQPVVRVEIIFDAGLKYEIKPGQAEFTTKMLGEGTKIYSANQIAEKLATIGFFIEFNVGAERAVITLNGLTMHLKKAIEIVFDIITYANFPITELEKIKTITKQNLLVNLEKTSYLASQSFKENLFGFGHFLGRTLDEKAIDSIEQKDIVSYFNSYFLNKPVKIFVSGKIEQQEIDILSEQFGNYKTNGKLTNSNEKFEIHKNNRTVLIDKPESLQSSIRIGKATIDRQHPDYVAFKVCNTILGGYFGSRLMKNIREEKGLTYGISSSHSPVPNYSYVLIGTDVKKEFTQATINEIHKEIKLLQTQLVDNEELEVVKNFIIGEFASSFNTPFDIAEKHKVTIFENLPSDFYGAYINKIKAVTAFNVMEAAQKYLDADSMIEIVVGGK
jgi:zinc protease